MGIPGCEPRILTEQRVACRWLRLSKSSSGRVQPASGPEVSGAVDRTRSCAATATTCSEANAFLLRQPQIYWTELRPAHLHNQRSRNTASVSNFRPLRAHSKATGMRTTEVGGLIDTFLSRSARPLAANQSKIHLLMGPHDLCPL